MMVEPFRASKYIAANESTLRKVVLRVVVTTIVSSMLKMQTYQVAAFQSQVFQGGQARECLLMNLSQQYITQNHLFQSPESEESRLAQLCNRDAIKVQGSKLGQVLEFR